MPANIIIIPEIILIKYECFKKLSKFILEVNTANKRIDTENPAAKTIMLTALYNQLPVDAP